MSGSTNTSTLPQVVGCFSSSFPLIDQGYYKYQSSGYCNVLCRNISKAVLGLSQGNQCWCGDDLPTKDSEVDSSQCNQPCQGYDLEECGGNGNILTVWLTGLNLDAPNYVPQGSSSASTSSSTSSATTSHTIAAGSSPMSSKNTTIASSSPTFTTSSRTSAVAAGAQSSASSAVPAATQHGHHHHEVLEIVLSTVLGGLFVLALLAGLLWFCWRRRKRRNAAYMQTQSQSPQRDSEGSIYSQPVEAAAVAPIVDEKQEEKQKTQMNGHVDPRPISSVAPLPPLRPPFLGGTTLRKSRQSSMTTSVDQPFYTPSEGPRSFIGSEPAEHALHSESDEVEALQQTPRNDDPAHRTYLAYDLPPAVQTPDHQPQEPHTSIPAELEANTRAGPAPPIADHPPVLPPIDALHQSEFFPNRESGGSFTEGRNDPFRSPRFAGTGFVPLDTLGRRSVSLASSRDSDDTDYHAR